MTSLHARQPLLGGQREVGDPTPSGGIAGDDAIAGQRATSLIDVDASEFLSASSPPSSAWNRERGAAVRGRRPGGQHRQELLPRGDRTTALVHQCTEVMHDGERSRMCWWDGRRVRPVRRVRDLADERPAVHAASARRSLRWGVPTGHRSAPRHGRLMAATSHRQRHEVPRSNTLGLSLTAYTDRPAEGRGDALRHGER